MARIPFDRGTRAVRAGAVRGLLRGSGFLPEETAYLFYFPRPLRLLRALEKHLLRVPLGAQYSVIARRTPEID